MIAFLRGQILRKTERGLVLNVSGVGYEVSATEETLMSLPEIGEEASLEIYTIVREDEISLYGFKDEMSRKIFSLLLKTSGVGPKMALGILAHCPVQVLIQAIQNEDIARIRQVKGVGEKTAKMLVAGLKNKVKEFAVDLGPVPISNEHSPNSNSLLQDVENALLNLGYAKSDVQRTLSVMDVSNEANLQGVLRKSLQMLSGQGASP